MSREPWHRYKPLSQVDRRDKRKVYFLFTLHLGSEKVSGIGIAPSIQLTFLNPNPIHGSYTFSEVTFHV
jgi:hypothetical protein